MKDQIKKQLYHVILGSVLITVNIFFSIFVWMPSDLSPNFALAFITLPFAIYEIVTSLRTTHKTSTTSLAQNNTSKTKTQDLRGRSTAQNE